MYTFSSEWPGLCVSARAACPCVRAVRLSLVVPGRSDGSCPLSRPDPVRSGLQYHGTRSDCSCPLSRPDRVRTGRLACDGAPRSSVGVFL